MRSNESGEWFAAFKKHSNDMEKMQWCTAEAIATAFFKACALHFNGCTWSAR